MPANKKGSKSIIADESIIRKIYVIRGEKVMLDFDLAALYGVETRSLNQAVKRNLDRFPEDFMFILTAKEWKDMISQFVISSDYSTDIQEDKNIMSQNAASSQKRRKSSSAPLAFTEHGVTMIASILKSEKAIKMSIAVVRAFIELKKAGTQFNRLTEQLEGLRNHLGEHDAQLNSIYEALENLMDDKIDKELKEKEWLNRKPIGFKM